MVQGEADAGVDAQAPVVPLIPMTGVGFVFPPMKPPGIQN